MIEPLVFETRDEIHRLEQDGIPLFAMSTNNSNQWYISIGLFLMNNSNRSTFLIWSNPNGLLVRCFNDYTVVSSAAFLDHLFEHYPDHAEWFLFHPEWLS